MKIINVLTKCIKKLFISLINLCMQFKIHKNIYQLSTEKILDSYKTFQVKILNLFFPEFVIVVFEKL